MRVHTQEYIRSIIDYNPDTGVFTWKRHKRGMRSGTIAGSFDDRKYVIIRIDKIRYYAHRLAFLHMNGLIPPNHVDHINRNKSNNRFSNLRMVTCSENLQNLSIDSRNTTGITGVCFDKIRGKWKSYIGYNNILINIGRYDSLLDAICSRKSAELLYNFSETHGMGV